MAKNNAAGLLSTLDDLFSCPEDRKIAGQPRVEEISIDRIDSFPNHPYKIRMNDSMLRLVESVREHGVLEPCLLRPMENGRYQMVAGHRRKEASILANRPSLRCVVQEMTDDQAVIIMVDSNLHREEILPSEKAFAYKMKLDAMKRQGKRTDLTCAPLGHKFGNVKTRDIIAEESSDSKSQIQRYIRLTYLIPEILDLVDNSVLQEKGKLQISMRPAVELSYLTEEEQHDLYDTMLSEDRTPSHVQAIEMREASQAGQLDMDRIFAIMVTDKPNQKEQFRIPKERISQFFPPGTPAKKIEDTIVKALELYRKRKREMQR